MQAITRERQKRNICYVNGTRAKQTFSATQPGYTANAKPTVITYNPGYATMVVEPHKHGQVPPDKSTGCGDNEMARPAAVGRTTCEEPAEANKPETPHAPPRATPRCDLSTSRGNQALRPERSLREIGKRPQQQELAVHVKSIATCIPGNRQDEAEKPINAPGRKGHYNESGRGIPRIIKIQWGRDVDSKGAGTWNWVGLGRLDRDKFMGQMDRP